MQVREGLTAIVAATLCMLAPGRAHAEDNDDNGKESFGLGASARQLRLTRGLAELFTDDAPPGTRKPGYSVEFAKRGERLEFLLGFGYDKLRATRGYYLEAGGDPLTPGQVDFTDFNSFHVYTVDATIVGYIPLHKILAIRYGAGLGVALVRGQILRTDAICTGTNIQRDCVPDPNGAQQREPMDIPKAIPVLNGLVGLQLRPVHALAISIDFGLHNVPYLGASAMLYLW